MASMDFDANDVVPSAGFEAIPAGKYRAVIEATEVKPTKAGTGKLLSITFVVLDGEYANRKLWSRLNLWNPNQQSVDIARSDLSAICRAVGVMKLQDTEQLHDLPLMINVKCKKREDTGEITNEIKGFEPVGGSAAAPKPTAPKPSPSNPAAPSGTPKTAPWKRAAKPTDAPPAVAEPTAETNNETPPF